MGVDNFSFICSSIWKVSKNWREIIVQDKSADRRRKSYIKQLKEEAEVRFVSKVMFSVFFFFPCVKVFETQGAVNFLKVADSSSSSMLT